MWTLVLFLALAAPENRKEAPPKVEMKEVTAFEGLFKLKGKQGDKEYLGLVKVVHVTATKAHLVFWYIGDSATVGLGIRTNDLLSISWTQGTVKGVSLVQIGKGNVHQVESYTLPGSGKAESETWTFWVKLKDLED